MYVFGESVNGVENRREIHKKHSEYTPKILHISEKYEQGREYQSYSEVEYYHAENRENQKKKCPCKYDTVEDTEDKKYYKGKSKVYKRGNIFGKKKQIFGNIHLCKDPRITEQ